MKKIIINKYFIAAFLVLTVIFGFSSFYIKEILSFASPKGYVKDHTIDTVAFILYIIYFFSVLLLFMPLLLPKLKLLINRLNVSFGNVKINNKISDRIIKFVLFTYVVIAPLFITGSMDISTDESTYINTVQNLYDQGKLLYKLDDGSYIIPKDMFIQNVLMLITKPFVSYSYLIPRIITFISSMLLISLLVFYNRDKYKLLLVLLASTPAFIFLSGTSYAENIALVPALIGVTFIEKYFSSRKNIHLCIASFMIALSAMTKIQLGIFLFLALLVLTIINYFEDKEYYYLIKVFIFSFILVFAISVFYWALMYNILEIKKIITQYYAFSYSYVTNAENKFNILINIERFFNFQTVFIASVVVSYFLNKTKEKNFIEKYFFVIVILNAIWFITMKGHNYRFMYFSQIGLILLSVRPLTLMLGNDNKFTRNITVAFLALFLTVGVIQNLKLTINGVSNEYLIYMNNNNPFKTYHNFIHDEKVQLNEI